MAYYNSPYYQYPYNYQQSYTNNFKTMEWVDGKVGAQAFQMPAGWPVNTPIALWDSTEKKIYLKSWNQMGMANQMQELTYEMKEEANPALLSGTSAAEAPNYATKDDINQLKQEIRNLMNNMNNMNNMSNMNNNNKQNRGGNQ